MQGGKTAMMFRRWAPMILVFSLVCLGTLSAYAQEEGPGTVCVLQVRAGGDVMAVVVDDTRAVDIAILVPRDNVSNLPIRCMDLDQIGLAVANQESIGVSFSAYVYTNNGEPKCSKGPFHLDVNGGQGVIFKDCP